MKRGISLINNKNRFGPRIETCGTPVVMYVNAEIPFPWTTACCLSLRYDVNQAIDLGLNLLKQNRWINEVESFFEIND